MCARHHTVTERDRASALALAAARAVALVVINQHNLMAGNSAVGDESIVSIDDPAFSVQSILERPIAATSQPRSDHSGLHPLLMHSVSQQPGVVKTPAHLPGPLCRTGTQNSVSGRSRVR